MSATRGFIIAILAAQLICAKAAAQSPIVTISLGPDQIGRIKTAQGITTRISFPGPVKEIICGDLYDPATGKGSFVVQRGDTDVFLKPIVPKGMSNLFVKVGEGGQQVYSFDLEIVLPGQASRVVNVQPAQEYATQPQQNQDSRAILARAQQQADEIIRNARQQADRLLAQAREEAEQIRERAAEIERQAIENVSEQVSQQFIRAMMAGLQERRVNNTRIEVKNITIALDPKMLIFNGRAYLRYAITNNGKTEFTFRSVVLEVSSGKEPKTIPIEVTQNHAENRLKPGETLTGIIAFDAKAIREKDRVSLSFRDAKNGEIARMNLQ